jgi:ring-1,2-phenylacetyl-CoA epoxidase subunit PaaC
MSTEITYSEAQVKALKEMLYATADDLLILGHRNSEWTGLGPVAEEDIAFSSMAQDKIGHSLALYNILQTLGEQDPDTVAFTRNAEAFHNCVLVEHPIGEYDFSLIRHFLFDHSSMLRFEMLAGSSFEPVAKVAAKFRGEIKYHIMHADTWIVQLGKGSEESRSRLQKALNHTFDLALGIFEPLKSENELISMGVTEGEALLQERWLESISPVLKTAGLSMPLPSSWKPVYGGRSGKHTEHLQPLLNEMSEVFRIDPGAEW